MSYTVVYHSIWERSVVLKASTWEQAQELSKIGKDQQYLVDIEDDSIVSSGNGNTD